MDQPHVVIVLLRVTAGGPPVTAYLSLEQATPRAAAVTRAATPDGRRSAVIEDILGSRLPNAGS